MIVYTPLALPLGSVKGRHRIQLGSHVFEAHRSISRILEDLHRQRPSEAGLLRLGLAYGIDTDELEELGLIRAVSQEKPLDHQAHRIVSAGRIDLVSGDIGGVVSRVFGLSEGLRCAWAIADRKPDIASALAVGAAMADADAASVAEEFDQRAPEMLSVNIIDVGLTTHPADR